MVTEGKQSSMSSEMALPLGLTTAAGVLAVRLRPPVLIACIVVGILAGPAAFGFVQAHDQIDLLAQLGVALLLFVVGLTLDPHFLDRLPIDTVQ